MDINSSTKRHKNDNLKPQSTKTKKMKLGEIYEILDSISPFSLQESWDNSGINLGNPHQEIDKIFLALEADLDIALNLPPNSLLITHHPLIFYPIKCFDNSNYPAKILQMLIQKNCALIALHTNFDKTHLNAYFAKEILGFADIVACNDNLIQTSKIAQTPIATLARQIKSKLDLKYIAYSAPKQDFIVSQVFVVCGSGASFWRQISQGEIIPHINPPISAFAESRTNSHKESKQSNTGGICLITGDVKYHDAMSAKCANVAIIDVTHYASERHFATILHNNLQNTRLNCIMLENFPPFFYLTKDL